METTSDITITKWLQGFDIPNQRHLHETKQTALNFSLIFKIYILIIKIVSQIMRILDMCWGPSRLEIIIHKFFRILFYDQKEI